MPATTRTSTVDGLPAADALELALLEHAEELHLERRGGAARPRARYSVPPSASSSWPGRRPRRRRTRPPRGRTARPRAAPPSGAAQFTRTKGRSRRGEASWSACATWAFPVPTSPWTSTVAFVGATRRMHLERRPCELGRGADERRRARGCARAARRGRSAGGASRAPSRARRRSAPGRADGRGSSPRRPAAPRRRASIRSGGVVHHDGASERSSRSRATSAAPSQPGRRRVGERRRRARTRHERERRRPRSRPRRRRSRARRARP